MAHKVSRVRPLKLVEQARRETGVAAEAVEWGSGVTEEGKRGEGIRLTRVDRGSHIKGRAAIGVASMLKKPGKAEGERVDKFRKQLKPSARLRRDLVLPRHAWATTGPKGKIAGAAEAWLEKHQLWQVKKGGSKDRICRSVLAKNRVWKCAAVDTFRRKAMEAG